MKRKLEKLRKSLWREEENFDTKRSHINIYNGALCHIEKNTSVNLKVPVPMSG